MSLIEKSDSRSDDVETGHVYPKDNKYQTAYISEDQDNAVPGESYALGDSLYARIQRFAGRFNIEQRGIERVPENERTDTNLFKLGTLWLSANMVVSSLAIGALGVPVFGVGFVDGLLTVLFFNLLGITPVCFFATFGPRFGLRQMVLSRFWYGAYSVKIIAFFNVLACLGWSAVNTIVAAQLINAVNNDVPGVAGIIIVAACTFFVTLFGYKVIHMFEYWAWIPAFAVFMIVLGEYASSGVFYNIPMGVGSTEAAAVLSFGASIFGFATGWSSYASDYSCYQPVNASRVKVFFWTWIGLIVPLLFTELLGLAIATQVDLYADTPNSYTLGYENSGIGGLLAAVLFPPLGRFGQFCLVVLALSTVANNCPNIYSLTFSLQLMSQYTNMVPRFIWTFIGSVIYVAIAIPGYSDFETALETFMVLIGYWLAIYQGIALMEHFVYKRGMRGYDIAIYNQPKSLPPGFAAALAFAAGIGGAVVGMAQVWYVGPLGRMIGNPVYGGDIGFELAFAFAAVMYLAARFVEKRYLKR